MCCGETWAVVRRQILTFGYFQDEVCVQSICGISLHDHLPNFNILNRCNTFSVESQLQIRILRQLGHLFRMPNDRAPKSA